jgi:hypothetical protein
MSSSFSSSLPQGEPDLFDAYHVGYRKQVEQWCELAACVFLLLLLLLFLLLLLLLLLCRKV